MTGCNSYDIRQMADDVGCEILHGSSATSQTGLLLFWGDRPTDPVMAEFWASTGSRIAGYVYCWSTCSYFTFWGKHV